jgi:hypothetical protein
MSMKAFLMFIILIFLEHKISTYYRIMYNTSTATENAVIVP